LPVTAEPEAAPVPAVTTDEDRPATASGPSAALASPPAPALATSATTTGGPMRLVPPMPPPRPTAVPTAPIPSESSAPLALT